MLEFLVFSGVTNGFRSGNELLRYEKLLFSAKKTDFAVTYSGTSDGEGGIYNTVNLNVYHYAGNNPVKYTDPMGMSAWEPTDTWDSSKEEAFREKFNKNVNNVVDAAIKDNKTIDCADVALTALVDTAKEMGLRLTFDVWDSSKKKYVSHSSSDSKFKNKKEFLFFVKQNMGAIGVYSRYNFDANGNATVEYVLANRGTTFDNVYDLEQNFDQFIGQSSDFLEFCSIRQRFCPYAP